MGFPQGLWERNAMVRPRGHLKKEHKERRKLRMEGRNQIVCRHAIIAISSSEWNDAFCHNHGRMYSETLVRIQSRTPPQPHLPILAFRPLYSGLFFW